MVNYVTYTGPLNSFCFPNSIIVYNKNVYVSGYELGRPINLPSYTNGHYDLVIIKYSQLLNASNNQEVLPLSNKLHQNFPNPFNPTTNIKFNINRKTLVNVSIYDVRGVKISEIINTELNQGEYEYNLNASNFPSGIYFYSLITEDFKETRKMILLK